ncbi:3-beta hydroxysteroid dehydrogenase [Pseudorhodoferax aquiterrae]|uniref:3-beta hydroxysteroid dehydrogenase n=1 Tax=Pseudorhodoferax aquiterrae TaxID=747304 RepID=A0ABQ3G6K2_9BURK|nr:NAD(P)-dependent oxidoreductase [Pseudorhodoferax aquiterrae]GHC93288.1 3-beta hydroxysteroid dehydrogenase [Pseudorhodoferax aquiterrae]
MSKIAILGITGNAGSRIANELLSRGHSVTGIARDPSKAAARPGLTLAAADATQAAKLAPLLRGHDVVVSATRFVGGIDAATLLAAARQAGVPRIAVVGGAGSLEVAPGVALIDTPQFPDAYKAEAGAGRVFLQALRSEKDLDWTFLSPSALFAPGERTGQFRLGGDQLLVDAQGNSHISMEDFAIALADEIERPAHARQRFTVGY